MGYAVASSHDGMKLLAAQYGKAGNGPGLLYTSADSGVKWAATSASAAYWNAVASSSDGTQLLAAQDGDSSGGPGQLYTSANSGAKWTSA